MPKSVRDTRTDAYTQYLTKRRLLGSIVQLPYQTHLRFLKLGRTLEIGCGVGRNFRGLPAGSVGVDHNAHSVAACRAAGFAAYTPDDFADAFASGEPPFETLLFAHVIEHMTAAEASRAIETYVPYLAARARIVVITPQEAGYRSDASHVRFCDFATNRETISAAGFEQTAAYSFPFPRPVGRVFLYNEFVTIGVRG